MRTAVVLQARLGSTRLPGKALLPLAGSPMLCHAMRALRLVRADEYVLATEEGSAPGLEGPAALCGFRIILGPEDDVLRRYCLAARATGADRIIRATGDNPLVSHELANLLLDRRDLHPADYSGFLGMPKGMGVELIEAEALFEAERLAVDPYEREHVCPYLYRRPERFRIDRVDAPAEYLLPKANLSVDTREDFLAVERVFASLPPCLPPSSLDVIAVLKRDARA